MPSSRPGQSPNPLTDLHPSLREPGAALQASKDTAHTDPRRSRQWAHHALTTTAEVVLATDDAYVIEQGITIRDQAQQLHAAADETLRPGADSAAVRRANRFLDRVNASAAAEAARYTNRGADTQPTRPAHEAGREQGTLHRAPERTRPTLSR
ncbi:hypothetical protein GII33_22715 (plasmid) [Gordonia pseudamarae]|jgi:hypothetical protein|uniref:hypothetical protein n=1 Tax=Gordonia pseudamarae TaxID=2831662 RepID=UPI001AFA6ED7|nr:hypothetical protein [Gordonia pseudamarae]QHN28908.1 hypothetical protein GII33_22715 [Gordonia pseudamarae]